MKPAFLLIWVATACTGAPTPAPDSGDADGDGLRGEADCDDADPATGAPQTRWTDADKDGFGRPGTGAIGCVDEPGYAPNSRDCDDDDEHVFPGAPERCNDIDDNCAGDVDEGLDKYVRFHDNDRDGEGADEDAITTCHDGFDWSTTTGDCDDTDDHVFTGARERCNNEDDDCDGVVDEYPEHWVDRDGDGYGDKDRPATACDTSISTNDGDCDDLDAAVHPLATEVCNGRDDDCNGHGDSSLIYLDADGDGDGAPGSGVIGCPKLGYSLLDRDCDDDDPAVNSFATELCPNGIDDDCDGITDSAFWYLDADGDGAGDPALGAERCASAGTYAPNDWDCDDTDPTEPVVADAAGGWTAAGTLADPLRTIEDALAQANSCVLVRAGTYREWDLDPDGKDLDIWGVDGAEVTIVDPDLSLCDPWSAPGCHPIWTMASGTNASPRIHGFTLRGGTGLAETSTFTADCVDSFTSTGGACSITTNDYRGGGVYVSGDDPSFEDVIFTENVLMDDRVTAPYVATQVWSTSHGGGLYAENAVVTLKSVTFTGNFASNGGGLYVADGATVTATHVWFDGNEASDGAAMATGGSLIPANAVVACNTATVDGGGLFADGTGSFTGVNTLWVDNTAGTAETNGATMYTDTPASLVLWNTIVEATSAAPLLQNAGTAAVGYADVVNSGGETFGGTWTTTGEITANGAQYTRVSCDGDWTNDDATLPAGAPSIDAGDPDPAYDDADGTRNDLGAKGGPSGVWPG